MPRRAVAAATAAAVRPMSSTTRRSAGPAVRLTTSSTSVSTRARLLAGVEHGRPARPVVPAVTAPGGRGGGPGRGGLGVSEVAGDQGRQRRSAAAMPGPRPVQAALAVEMTSRR